MKKFKSIIDPIGDLEIIIDYDNGEKSQILRENLVLRTGRAALAASLANSIGDSYNFYVSRMLFGDGGTDSGVPKYVSSERNGLFGLTRASKSIISRIDPNFPTQVIFTTVLAKTEANGIALSEAALQMNTGDLYSMATFGDVNKTSSMQLTINWRISFV